jgi:hypothetical protein
MKTREILLAAVALATLALPAGSWAQDGRPPWLLAQSQGREGNILSVREIIAEVHRQLGEGDVIGLPQFEDNGGRPSYKVRWRRPDGVVLDIRVDARSGRVIGRAG